ncbi:MAG: enoyl-CoA hydratase/isomerase family protein [Deltaproteobacteria bacterium]|jgi:cyclohexa-1,5-dienecarbonyl-CoA hydratase|nr:enoyl-CoA hydratase/isomerase family protein [Deltaproteobacteria bacterium]
MSKLKYHKFEKTNGAARICLARPKHNVLNLDMMKELNSVLESLCSDKELKCLVFLGEGKSWCAGVEVGDHKPECAPEMIETFDRIFDLLGQLDVPVIAAVHGACLGGGMELAIGCDIVFASANAKFGQPEIKLGFFPPYAAARLPEIVGTSKAIEICTTGRTYTAREALELGFVSKVVEEEKFTETVDALVDEICYNSPLIIRMNKRAIKMVRGCEPREAAKKTNDYFLNSLMKTEDTLEGIKSFEEKRKPVWKNK